MSRVPTFGRQAPEHVLRGLRSLDPQAELVWIEKDRWLLGRFAPENERPLQEAGWNLKRSTWAAIARRNGIITHTDVVRLRFAELRLACFQTTTEYHMPLPDSAVVHDQQVMDWMFKNLSDDAVDRALHEDTERERKASREDLIDTERARAAFKYLFTTSHYLGRESTNLDTGPRSGWKRHKTIQ
jgi:hypothetical protein